jgi:Transcriptional regulator
MNIEPNLYHLKYFISAAALGGIAPAAKLHNVSQPAVSQGIKSLEQAFGCEILVHSRNRFKLTEEGKVVLGRARELLASLDGLRGELKGQQKEIRGDVSIATSDSLALSFLPHVFSKLQTAHAGLKPLLEMGSANNILERVKSGACEIGLLIDDGKIKGVQKKLLHEGVFQCVGKVGLKLSAKPAFIATQEAPGADELSKLYKKEFGKDPEFAMKVESWDVIAKMAEAGLGVGFLPDFVANGRKELRAITALDKISEKIKYKIYVIHNGEHQLSRNAKVILDFISKSKFN